MGARSTLNGKQEHNSCIKEFCVTAEARQMLNTFDACGQRDSSGVVPGRIITTGSLEWWSVTSADEFHQRVEPVAEVRQSGTNQSVL